MDNEKNSSHSGNSIKTKTETAERKNSSSAAGMPSKSTSSSPNNATGARPSKFGAFLAHLPPWIRNNLTKHRSLKTLFRCWLASWVAFVIILPDASLNTLGTACVKVSNFRLKRAHNFCFSRAFFALLCSFFIPPNMPVQLFIYVSDTWLSLSATYLLNPAQDAPYPRYRIMFQLGHRHSSDACG